MHRSAIVESLAFLDGLTDGGDKDQILNDSSDGAFDRILHPRNAPPQPSEARFPRHETRSVVPKEFDVVLVGIVVYNDFGHVAQHGVCWLRGPSGGEGMSAVMVLRCERKVLSV